MPRVESIPPARSLEKEPSSSLRLIDPDFNEAGGSNIAMFVTDVVRLAQARGQRSIVLRELGEHVQGLDVLGIVIEHTLSSSDAPD
jgi:hypothetical protein